MSGEHERFCNNITPDMPDMCDNSASRAGGPNLVEALGTIKHQKHLPNVTKAFL